MYDLFQEKSSENGSRLHFFQQFLLEKIQLLEQKAGSSFKFVPLIFSGMASSSIGLKELAYGELPFTLKKPALPYEWLKASDAFPYDLLLISGLKCNSDVMRGEETQVLGLAHSYDITNSLILIPGTHSKHVVLENGSIQSFKTYMTGELFEIVSKHSILSHSISNAQSFPDFIAFRRGVQEGAEEKLLNILFKVRTNTLFDKFSPTSNYYFLSGLLIGTELADLKEASFSSLFLCGEGIMQSLYKEALSKLGLLDRLTVLEKDEINHLVVHGHMQFLMGLD